MVLVLVKHLCTSNDSIFPTSENERNVYIEFTTNDGEDDEEETENK
jgi:hypothetical protein